MRQVQPVKCRPVVVALLMMLGLAAFLLPGVPLPVAAEGGMTYLEPYPRGEVIIRQPEIGWPVRVHGAKVRRAVLYLEGPGWADPVPLTYDPDKGAYVYHPPELLAPGRYQARIRLEFYGLYQPVERQWTFEIHPDGALPSALMAEAAAPQVQAALEAANDYRERLGLPPFQVHPSLMLSAREHAAYLAANGILSHFQEPGNRGFTGRTVEERAHRAGYFFGVAEDISQQPEPDPVTAIDGLFDAPYHRIPFMLPQAWDWGYGQQDAYHVMNVGVAPMETVRIVHAPAAGETGVPLQWDGHEVPDPLRLHAGAAYPAGYPIVLGAFGDAVREVRLLNARLTDGEGKEQRLYFNTPANDEELRRELILIPVHPLKPDMEYRVAVDWVIVDEDGREQPLHTAWTFQTERRMGEGKKRLHASQEVPAAGEGGIRTEPPAAIRDDVFTHVTFWSDVPLFQSWTGSFSLPVAVSQERLAEWARWLNGRFGIAWDDDERRLRWTVGGYQLEWLFD